MSNTLLPKNLNNDTALFRFGKPDYSKLDAASFPSPSDPKDQGAILEVTDTGYRYQWTGSMWVLVFSPRLITSATVGAATALNATTSTTIAASNSKRRFIAIQSDGSQAVWIKLQAASVDNAKKGIFISASPGVESRWEMPQTFIYTGEICAIADTGTPNVYVTEY